MEELELKLVKDKIKEDNHLANIYKNKRYRGWYRHNFIENKSFGFEENIFIRFRLPPKLALYGKVLRNFTEEERKVGIHRMLVGEDLQDQIKSILEDENPQEYMKTLDDETVANLLDNMKNMITFNCNKIPYLHIVSNEFSKIDINKEIRNFLDSQKDYLQIFKDVLNKNISIEEASSSSSGIIVNELIELSELS